MKQPTTGSARFVLATVLAAWFALPAVPQGGGSETGVASWYGYPYHGRFAASGELYNMDDLTAAHPTLPFNTLVRVVNLSNDRSVEVRITDRGPFVDGRIIDLSRAAARSIGLIEPGTAQVRLEVSGNGGLAGGAETSPRPAESRLPAGLPAPPSFAVQTGAFRDRGNAGRLSALMRSRYGSARMMLAPGDSGIWRVLAGPETTREGADALCQRIRRDSGENNAFVVRLDSSHEPDRPGQFPRPRGTVAADGLHSPSN
jgi:rare lipoprotein A